ncbi:high-affinity nickel-transporter [Catenulispora acidiphila DSM 44928]|uniref:Nickel/cobalt efflux system n=1 Tax=Catenulispora acidiphila (strain DSM 44928 / JCM 14897 / NBRC 102108 / NRRL B-24433 / ID139908) TaxID=479433 RepID=C7Q6L8_CATAD|nr:HoxN/HupN/NixA family nickel/cobalt transporter [Catenulispora acidiphila]ACU74053.1 high-affinity nickel-transporter [Catenulispora acidiphila DSM 44928]
MTATTAGTDSAGPATTAAPAGSRLARIRASLTPAEWGRVGGMFGFIALLHVVGWGILAALVVPGHYQLQGGLFGFGTGLTAYTLGMRHAFDADHIAAIDNTTRKLMAEGKRPLSVGFWFSLGHSTIVVVLTLLLGLGLKGLGVELSDDKSGLHSFGGLIGTTVSGTFLYLIAIINLVVLVGILKVFRQMRRGEFDEATLEEHLNNRGLMNRFLGRAMKAVTKPWQIYPVGVLFGLGFDTVTEVGLLVLAGTSVASGLPWYAVMCLPVLFAAGMSLLDTIDGSFMNFAYGWAFSKPVRKVFYNITITGLSVAVALIIGTIELLSILQDKLNLTGGFWNWIANVDLNSIGFAIVGMFLLVWLAAVAVWKFGRIEQKWTAALPVAEDVTDQ